MQTIHTIKERVAQSVSQCFFAVMAILLVAPAHAQLPTTAPPTRATTDGNYIQLLQNYAYDIFIFGGLAMSVLALFVVVKNTLSAYSEVSTGKGTMGQVAMHAGVGVILLVFIVFLLTEAAAIL